MILTIEFKRILSNPTRVRRLDYKLRRDQPLIQAVVHTTLSPSWKSLHRTTWWQVEADGFPRPPGWCD